jgi:hypothetical protein
LHLYKISFLIFSQEVRRWLIFVIKGAEESNSFLQKLAVIWMSKKNFFTLWQKKASTLLYVFLTHHGLEDFAFKGCDGVIIPD